MENKKSHINNHFLQKGLVKNFASNGYVKWIKYKTKQKGRFKCSSKNNEQVISKKHFYSKEIEIGMNGLESEGIKVVRKIAFAAQINEEISISRSENLTLKCYSLLSSVRTNKLRKNINEHDGDWLFRKMLKNDSRTAQKIQESQIALILKCWKDINFLQSYYKNHIKPILTNNKKTKSNITYENHIITELMNLKNSRLIIFRFNKSKLFLTETLLFTEKRQAKKGNLLCFMPLAPNVGIAFYYASSHFLEQRKDLDQNSTIFKSGIANTINQAKYKNAIDSSMPYSYEDEFIYKVLNETEEVADFCNAMALVHNKSHILIYQKDGDIASAEKMVREKGIFRIEDYT